MSKIVTFSQRVENLLREKAEQHNTKVAKPFATTPEVLKVVYRRGATSFSLSQGQDMSRDAWALGRVDAFLTLLRTGNPENPKYTADNDLLPSAHVKSSGSLTASGDLSEHLVVELKDSYDSPEEAIFALTEYMGLGYEAEPAVRAAWIRAVKNEESPYQRALHMAQYTFDSKDADLLPKPKGVSS